MCWGRLWEFIALPRLQFFLLHISVCRYGLSASYSDHLLPCLPHHYGLSNSNSYFYGMLLVMAFYHQSRKITNREVGTRELGYSWDKSDHVGFWRSMEDWHFGQGKQLAAVNRANRPFWWEPINRCRNRTLERGAGSQLATVLKAVCVIDSWQGIGLPSPLS